MQLAWQSTDQRWIASAGYAWERGNNAMGQVGTSLALSPFFNPNLNISQQWGITFAHQANSKIGISAAYARSKATSRAASSFLGIAMTAAGDSAETQSWMLAVNVNNLIAKGNNAGFGVGGVPTVYSNRSGWGVDGAMPIALEAWYQWRLTDSLSITPGAFHISASANKNGFDDGASWGGVIKTQFNF